MEIQPNDFGKGYDEYLYTNADKLNPLDLWRVKVKIEHLRGEVLTIIDAVLGGDDRLKSTKDLIHSAFNGHQGVVYKMGYQDSILEKQENARTKEEFDRATENLGVTSK